MARKEAPPVAPDTASAQKVIERTVELLKSWIVSSQPKWSQRQIEVALGWGRGYLSQVFTGRIAMKMEHPLLVLAVLGRDSGEFFAELFDSGAKAEADGTDADAADLVQEGVIAGLVDGQDELWNRFSSLQQKLTEVEGELRQVKRGIPAVAAQRRPEAVPPLARKPPLK